MDDPNSPCKQAPLSKEETEALNRHGVFFKKRVLQELGAVDGISIICEELGVSFGETRVIDILAVDRRQCPYVFFVFECKRAYAADRRWIFFRDFDQRYRVVRVQAGGTKHSSVFAQSVPPHPVVCSEGYEYSRQDKRADQDPVFKASAQLSAGYLSLIGRRQQEMLLVHQEKSIIERFVPILVTTAEILIVQPNSLGISLDSGNALKPPVASVADILILKHPFPTPKGADPEFRNNPNPQPSAQHWSQLHRESIYVVRISGLRKFLAEDHRDYLRSAKSED